MKHKHINPISVILVTALMWQQVAWAHPDEFCSLRALALQERSNVGLALNSKLERSLIGVSALTLAIGIGACAIFCDPKEVISLVPKIWTDYYEIYYVLCGLTGHGIASLFIDKDRHWSRFVAMSLALFLYALAIPRYADFTMTTIPDFGVWSRSLRPLVDLFFFSQPTGIAGFFIMGLRDRLLDTVGKEKILSKDWLKETWSYDKEKIKLFYGDKGLFKIQMLFWMPIIHFTYYSSGSLETIVGIAASVAPVFAVVSAIFMVQRPGKELTNKPLLNWMLRHSYLAPLAAIAGLAVCAAILGYAALAANSASALLTGLVGYVVYKVWNKFLQLLFSKFSKKAIKTNEIMPNVNDGRRFIEASILRPRARMERQKRIWERPFSEGGLLEVAKMFSERAPYFYRILRGVYDEPRIRAAAGKEMVSIAGQQLYLHPALFGCPEDYTRWYLNGERVSKSQARMFLTLLYAAVKETATRLLGSIYDVKFDDQTKEMYTAILTGLFLETWLLQDSAFYSNQQLLLRDAVAGARAGDQEYNNPNAYLHNLYRGVTCNFNANYHPIYIRLKLQDRISNIARTKGFKLDDKDIIPLIVLHTEFAREYCESIRGGYASLLAERRRDASENQDLRLRTLESLADFLFVEPAMVDFSADYEHERSICAEPEIQRRLIVTKYALQLYAKMDRARQLLSSVLAQSHIGGEARVLENRGYIINADLFRVTMRDYLLEFLSKLPYKGVHIVFTGSVARGNFIIGSDHDCYVVTDEELPESDKEIIIEALHRVRFDVHTAGIPIMVERDLFAANDNVTVISRSEFERSIREEGSDLVRREPIKARSLLESWIVSNDGGFIKMADDLISDFKSRHGEQIRKETVNALLQEAGSCAPEDINWNDFKTAPLSTMTLNQMLMALRLQSEYAPRLRHNEPASHILSTLLAVDTLSAEESLKLYNMILFFALLRMHRMDYEINHGLAQDSRARTEDIQIYLSQKMGFESPAKLAQEITEQRQWMKYIILKVLPRKHSWLLRQWLEKQDAAIVAGIREVEGMIQSSILRPRARREKESGQLLPEQIHVTFVLRQFAEPFYRTAAHSPRPVLVSEEEAIQAIRDYFVRDGCENTKAILLDLFGPGTSLENIDFIDASNFQNGRFYKVYKAQINLKNGNKAFFILEHPIRFGRANRLLVRDYYYSTRLYKRHPGEVVRPLRLGVGNGMSIVAMEWLGDYIELKDRFGINDLRLNDYGRLQDPVSVWQLAYRQSTFRGILTRMVKDLVKLAEYRPSTNKVSFISQICVGAGDFMFRPLEGGEFDLKLITVRHLERNASPVDFVDYLLGNKAFFIPDTAPFKESYRNAILKGIAQGLTSTFGRDQAEVYFKNWLLAFKEQLSIIESSLRTIADKDWQEDDFKSLDKSFIRWLERNSETSEVVETRFSDIDKGIARHFLKSGHRLNLMSRFISDQLELAKFVSISVDETLGKNFDDLIMAEDTVEYSETGALPSGAAVIRATLSGVLRPRAKGERGDLLAIVDAAAVKQDPAALYPLMRVIIDDTRPPQDHKVAIDALKKFKNKEILRQRLQAAVDYAMRYRIPGNWEMIGTYINQANPDFIRRFLPLTQRLFLKKLIVDYLQMLNRDLKIGNPEDELMKARLLRLAGEIKPAKQYIRAHKLLCSKLKGLGGAPTGTYRMGFISDPVKPRLENSDIGFQLLAERITKSAPELITQMSHRLGQEAVYGYVIEALVILLNSDDCPLDDTEAGKVKAYIKEVARTLATAESETKLRYPDVSPEVIFIKLDNPNLFLGDILMPLKDITDAHDASIKAIFAFAGQENLFINSEEQLRRIVRLLSVEPEASDENDYISIFFRNNVLERGAVVAGHFCYFIDADNKAKRRIATTEDKANFEKAISVRSSAAEIISAKIDRIITTAAAYYAKNGRLPSVREWSELAGVDQETILVRYGNVVLAGLRAQGVPLVGNSYDEMVDNSKKIPPQMLKAILGLQLTMDYYIPNVRNICKVGDSQITGWKGKRKTWEKLLGKPILLVCMKRDAEHQKLEIHAICQEGEGVRDQILSDEIRLPKDGNIAGVEDIGLRIIAKSRVKPRPVLQEQLITEAPKEVPPERKKKTTLAKLEPKERRKEIARKSHRKVRKMYPQTTFLNPQALTRQIDGTRLDLNQQHLIELMEAQRFPLEIINAFIKGFKAYNCSLAEAGVIQQESLDLIYSISDRVLREQQNLFNEALTKLSIVRHGAQGSESIRVSSPASLPASSGLLRNGNSSNGLPGNNMAIPHNGSIDGRLDLKALRKNMAVLNELLDDARAFLFMVASPSDQDQKRQALTYLAAAESKLAKVKKFADQNELNIPPKYDSYMAELHILQIRLGISPKSIKACLSSVLRPRAKVERRDENLSEADIWAYENIIARKWPNGEADQLKNTTLIEEAGGLDRLLCVVSKFSLEEILAHGVKRLAGYIHQRDIDYYIRKHTFSDEFTIPRVFDDQWLLIVERQNHIIESGQYGQEPVRYKAMSFDNGKTFLSVIPPQKPWKIYYATFYPIGREWWEGKNYHFWSISSNYPVRPGMLVCGVEAQSETQAKNSVFHKFLQDGVVSASDGGTVHNEKKLSPETINFSLVTINLHDTKAADWGNLDSDILPGWVYIMKPEFSSDFKARFTVVGHSAIEYIQRKGGLHGRNGEIVSVATDSNYSPASIWQLDEVHLEKDAGEPFTSVRPEYVLGIVPNPVLEARLIDDFCIAASLANVDINWIPADIPYRLIPASSSYVLKMIRDKLSSQILRPVAKGERGTLSKTAEFEYPSLVEFATQYKMGPMPDGKGSFMTAKEIAEKELSAAISAIDTIRQVRLWMDQNGAKNRPLIVWQNSSVGDYYPYFTEQLRDRLGVVEISMQQLRGRLYQEIPVETNYENYPVILVRGKKSSEAAEIDTVTQKCIQDFGDMITAPVLMIDHSYGGLSGAQNHLQLEERKNNNETIEINFENSSFLKYRKEFLEKRTFFILFNSNPQPLNVMFTSSFDDWRIDGKVFIAGKEVLVTEVLKKTLEKVIDNVTAAEDSKFNETKIIVWDFDDTLWSPQAQWRPGVPEVFHRLQRKNARNIIATLNDQGHVGDIMNKTGLILPIDSMLGVLGKDYLGTVDYTGGKSYGFITKRLKINEQETRDNMIIIGNSEMDMPRDMEGVVFICVDDMSLQAGAIEDLITLVDEAGNGRFGQGFEELFNHADSLNNALGNDIRKFSNNNISFLLRHHDVVFRDNNDKICQIRVPAISDIKAHKDYTREILKETQGQLIRTATPNVQREERRDVLQNTMSQI